MFFLLLELGVKPSCYCYKLQGTPSEDCERAKYLANHFGLKLTTALIPLQTEVLAKDVQTLLKMGIRGKVCIQCCHGHWYTAKLVQEPVIFNGSGIDALYGSYKAMFLVCKDNKAIFDKLREKHLADPNDDAMIDQQKIYNKNKVKVLYPYRQRNIIDFLMSKSWLQINTTSQGKHKMKAIIVEQFPEFQAHQRLWRPRGSQQIVAGVREFHDRLLHTEHNIKNRTRVQDLYKDMADALALSNS